MDTKNHNQESKNKTSNSGANASPPLTGTPTPTPSLSNRKYTYIVWLIVLIGLVSFGLRYSNNKIALISTSVVSILLVVAFAITWLLSRMHGKRKPALPNNTQDAISGNSLSNVADPQPGLTSQQYDYAQTFVVYHKHPILARMLGRDQGVLAIQGSNLVFADIKGHLFNQSLTSTKFIVNSKGLLVLVLAPGQKWYFDAFNEFYSVNKQLPLLAGKFKVSQTSAQKASVSSNLSGARATEPVELAAASMGTRNLIGSTAETVESIRLFGQQFTSQDAQINAFVSELQKRGVSVDIHKKNVLLRGAEAAGGHKEF